jgi:hypothetical protein
VSRDLKMFTNGRQGKLSEQQMMLVLWNLLDRCLPLSCIVYLSVSSLLYKEKVYNPISFRTTSVMFEIVGVSRYTSNSVLMDKD